MKDENYETINIYYDEQEDFLEISFEIPLEFEYVQDIDSEVFVTRDRESNKIKGIGILNFKSGAKTSILKRILKELNISIPSEISILKS